MSTLGRMPELEVSLKTLIINKLLQTIEHDDARVRTEALRAIVCDIFFLIKIIQCKTKF